MQSLFIKDKKFYSMVAKIAVPIALQGLITSGVNMMDTIMVGAVGETELSAVSLANQFINIFHIFCMGIGMGASVLVARYYGMKDTVSLKRTVAIMLRLCLGMSALFCVATILLPRQIMCIYTVEEEIIAKGIEYLNYSVITYFLLGLSLTCTIVLRNVEMVKIPLYTSIGAFFINVGANYAFIFGKFGLPCMGVAGAAVGTLVARIFEFSMICGYLFLRDKKIGFRIKDLFVPVGNLWKEYIRISIPVLVSDGILALGNNSVAMVIGRLGESFVAANAVTAVTQQLSSVLIQGFSQAGAIVTGYTLGQGDREKAHRQGYAFLGLGIVFGAVAAGIIMLISEPMIRAYNLLPQTQDIARELMLSISLIVLFQATNSIMTKGVLRGGGDTKILMVADNVFLWVASIPLGVIAGLVLELPAFWIYFFLKIDQVLKAVWCVIRLRSGKWIKKIKSSKEYMEL
ncbi:MAG: MATE family efflux transporter [Lachnospiraceae bacterium]|nr:MATE family efflux transporter [Lachnospiraceae bacterium]MBR4060833.1 MATE family efflux transporter [Lachnospiraceae bacterium]